MNSQERETFWQTLCSLKGTGEEDIQKLMKTIKYPKYLCRYRSVSINSLEALRSNRLYFSSANYYDDPFDTFLHIDIERLKEEFLSAFQTPESTEAVVEGVIQIVGNLLSKEQIEKITVENITEGLSHGLVENFLDSMLNLRDEVKKDIWSVCFSENGLNETLWLKYADQYKGFVQIYDVEDGNNFLCGKQEKCVNCARKNYRTPIYPIYYSDNPYDATDFAKLIMLNKLEEAVGSPIPQYLYEELDEFFWEREKITLIKKKCHEYDEEWRMVTKFEKEFPEYMKWRPSGIILGLRMGRAEENLVISMAKEAGIDKIYKSYIDTQNSLNAVLINV